MNKVSTAAADALGYATALAYDNEIENTISTAAACAYAAAIDNALATDSKTLEMQA